MISSKYIGSAKNGTSLRPYRDYDFGNGFLIGTTQGLEFNYHHNLAPNIDLAFGSSFGYDMGRKKNDDQKSLNGLGDIKGSLYNHTE